MLYRAPILDLTLRSQRATLPVIMSGYSSPVGSWDVAFNTSYFDSKGAYGLLIFWGNQKQQPYPDWPCLVVDESGHARITEKHSEVGTVRHAIGMGPLLVRSSQAVNIASELKRKGYDERLLWSALRENENTARTVVGILPDKQVLAGIYVGTLQAAADAMARQGCVTAIYSDGGGSSGAVLRGSTISYGANTRALAAALVLVKAVEVDWDKPQTVQKSVTVNPGASGAVLPASAADTYYAGPVVSKKLAENFNLTEFASSDTQDQVLVSYRLVELLQQLRSYVGRPVVLTSGYRTAAHNRAVGGAKNSQHQYGRAADIKITGYTPAQVADIAKRFGATGVGTYSSWTHVDVRPGALVEWQG